MELHVVQEEAPERDSILSKKAEHSHFPVIKNDETLSGKDVHCFLSLSVLFADIGTNYIIILNQFMQFAEFNNPICYVVHDRIVAEIHHQEIRCCSLDY